MSKSDHPLGIVSFLFALSIGFWGAALVKFVGTLQDWFFTDLFNSMMLVAGAVFLADIVCIMWWYAKYIHRIQGAPTLESYFLDFGICAMFNVAATQWTEYKVFLTSTLFGSALLFVRFFKIYRSPEANDTDRRILIRAGIGLAVAMTICMLALGIVASVIVFRSQEPEALIGAAKLFQKTLYPYLVICLSGIGVVLTFWLREKIEAAGDMHEYYRRRFVPMELYWPYGLASDTETRGRIIHSARKGLDRFYRLFRGGPRKLDHDRVRSRVHPEGDLRVQSYILATPSWTLNGQSIVEDEEVEKKAFMVGVSHWLDDLMDGKEELEIYRTLKTAEGYGLTLEGSQQIFRRIYGDIIVNHTNRGFLDRLIDDIAECVHLPENKKYLFFSLNRVAIGAALFGPKLKHDGRQELLEEHNSRLVSMVMSEDPTFKDPWYRDLLNLLTDMRADPDGLGKVLVGLTTKTVQEMAMASERYHVRFATSLLYSMLYTPLLYFHDIDNEIECSEMVPLDAFDVSYQAIVPWLERMRDLLRRNDAPRDMRRDSRLMQLEMAFRCFKPSLPKVIVPAIESVYVIADKRAHPRVPAELPVRCTVHADAETTREVVGQLANVSLGGLAVLLAEKLASGTMLRLQMELPGRPVTADGTVVWQDLQSKGIGKGPHGIQLLRFLDEADRIQYKRFLSQAAADHAAKTA